MKRCGQMQLACVRTATPHAARVCVCVCAQVGMKRGKFTNRRVRGHMAAVPFLTQNVWFAPVEPELRMAAIVAMIEVQEPVVIGFQGVCQLVGSGVDYPPPPPPTLPPCQCDDVTPGAPPHCAPALAGVGPAALCCEQYHSCSPRLSWWPCGRAAPVNLGAARGVRAVVLSCCTQS
jgi:hypothetical protein